MTSKDRNAKDTPSRGARSTRPSTVQKRKDPEASDSAGSGVAQTPEEAVVESIHRQLVDHLDTLRFVNGTLAVCVQALQQQDADMDAEIALVLQRTVGDKLDATIDQIEELVFGLELREIKEEVA